jgi:hypothetical protein
MKGTAKRLYGRDDVIKVSFYKGDGLTEFSHVTLSSLKGDGVIVDFLPSVASPGSTSVAIGSSSTKRTSAGTPDVCVYLYGLDIDRIQNSWGFIAGSVEWCAVSGKGISASRDGKIHINSAGLCLGLLCLGGFLNFHGKSFVDSKLQAFANAFLSLGKGIVHTAVGVGAAAVPVVVAVGGAVATLRGDGNAADRVGTIVRTGAVVAPLASLAFSEAKKAIDCYAEVSISFLHVAGIITPTKLEEIVLAAHAHQKQLIDSGEISIDSASTADLKAILPPEERGCTIV